MSFLAVQYFTAYYADVVYRYFKIYYKVISLRTYLFEIPYDIA